MGEVESGWEQLGGTAFSFPSLHIDEEVKEEVWEVGSIKWHPQLEY